MLAGCRVFGCFPDVLLFICPNQPHIRPFLVRFEAILPTAYRFGVIQTTRPYTWRSNIFKKARKTSQNTHDVISPWFQKTRADMILL
jgi:hypothetical protein